MVKQEYNAGGTEWRPHVAELAVGAGAIALREAGGDTHTGELPDAAPGDLKQPEPPVEQFVHRPDDN